MFIKSIKKRTPKLFFLICISCLFITAILPMADPVAIKSSFSSALSAATVPSGVNAVATNTSYNQTYLQDYPSTTNSIFTKIQGFINSMLNPQGWTLTDLKTLLTNAQNKSFLTSAQKAFTKGAIDGLNNLMSFSSALAAATTPSSVNVIVTNASYNQPYLQNYPSTTNSVYAKIQGFVNSMSNPQGWILDDLGVLLTNAKIDTYLFSSAQITTIGNWLIQVRNYSLLG